jgi:hypothetical protein
MDRWLFADATAAIETSTSILAARDEIALLAAGEGLRPDGSLEADYEAAASRSELAALGERIDVSGAVLDEVAAAADAVEAPRDWLTAVGLDGEDPAGALAAARAAWEAGDLEAARRAAAEARATLADAPETGRTRVIAYGAGGTVLIVVLGGLVVAVVTRRREAAARRARAVAVAAAAQAAAPGAAWTVAPGALRDAEGPYATLPPDGLPGEPPGGSTSGDEGADRS